uniref:RxLR effector candidate protein n=2 Tax=Hyaloperonospora arabidopsidis (strain Emoy2) TaxID=559515 RepID=M4BM57_HYAAE|nr:RxLR effector candidate protein [Hyaloperonospora arabidopsidis Emoy2]
MNAADQYLPWIKKRTRCGSKGKISVTPSVAYECQSLGLLGQSEKQSNQWCRMELRFSLLNLQSASHKDHNMRRLCLALTAVGSFRSCHAELLYDPDQANGVPDPTARRLTEAEFDQRSFALRRMSAEDVASSVTRRLVEPNNLAPNNDDVALDTYEERYLIVPPSETAANSLLRSLMVRISRLVNSRADVPHPEKNFKTLRLHKGPMDIDNFIRWVEYVRKYRRARTDGNFHMFDSSVEILKRYRKPKELMELLILLRERSGEENARHVESLLTSLVLSHYDSPEALLTAWLDMNMDVNKLYDLLQVNKDSTLSSRPKIAIMWLRYNALLVAKREQGAMTVDESVKKLLERGYRRYYVKETILPLLEVTEGKPKSDVELLTAVKEFIS